MLDGQNVWDENFLWFASLSHLHISVDDPKVMKKACKKPAEEEQTKLKKIALLM